MLVLSIGLERDQGQGHRSPAGGRRSRGNRGPPEHREAVGFGPRRKVGLRRRRPDSRWDHREDREGHGGQVPVAHAAGFQRSLISGRRHPGLFLSDGPACHSSTPSGRWTRASHSPTPRASRPGWPASACGRPTCRPYEKLREQVEILYTHRRTRGSSEELTEYALDLCRHSTPYQVVVARVEPKGSLAETLEHLRTEMADFRKLTALSGGDGLQ